MFANAQNEVWIKNSPEIRLSFKSNPIEIRWRPIDQMIMPVHYFGKHSMIRTDLMIGLNLWKFKIFSYTKYDEFNRFWTGGRFDLNLDFFNKKFLLNIQTRYFIGLNSNSDDHYYLIEYPRLALEKKLFVGILSYGKWKTSSAFNTGNWFVGPSIEVGLPYHFKVHVAFTNDVFHTNLFMLFIRLGYKIKL